MKTPLVQILLLATSALLPLHLKAEEKAAPEVIHLLQEDNFYSFLKDLGTNNA
ncbi:MAG: hypothetical protein JWM68_4088 [Verrucomicrobiales bacterium]|nr:hypothetical protein [Verrucomicrobiales bacterium]